MKPGEFIKNHTRELAIATAVTLGGFGYVLASNEGDSGATAAVETTILSQQQEQTAAELCDAGFDMTAAPSVEFAEANVGSPESLFSDFSVTTSEGTELISASEFADKFLAELCVKPDALAAVMAFAIEPAGYNDEGNLFFPDSATVSRMQKLARQYRENPGEALDAITTVASIVKSPAGVVKNTFVVPDGSGSIIAPARNENGAYGIGTIELPVAGAIDVFQFGFSVARTDLTEDDRKILRQLSELIGFDAQGRMLLSRWIGQSEVDLTPEEETDDTVLVATSLDPTVSTTIAVNPNQTSTSVDGEAPATATSIGASGENGQTNEGDGSGNDNSNNGGGRGNEPGQTSTPDAPGGADGETPIDVPGNPETTGNGTPTTGGTPTTRPTSTTGAPTTTTRPSTTTSSTSTTVHPTTTTSSTSTTTSSTSSTTTTVPATTTTRPSQTTTTLPKGTVPPTTGCDEFNPCALADVEAQYGIKVWL